MQVNLSKIKNNKFFINTNDKAIFLFFGLCLWVFIPILGIFLLLFFVHLNKKQNSQLNFFVTLLVILTITIFVSSTDIISDLAVYVFNYERLDTKTPFEISGAQGLEFVFWLASYPIHYFSNGSRYAFIFFWFFVFNCLTFLIINKGFSSKNYALLSLFIVSTPTFINYQGFLVRQYLATLIFLIAVINIENRVYKWVTYLTSLFTHASSIIYLPGLLLYDKSKFFKSKIVKIFVLIAGLILPFSTGILLNLANNIAKFIPGKYALVILSKTDYYALNKPNTSSFSIMFLENVLIFLIITFCLKNESNQSAKDRVMYMLYPVLLFLMLIGRDIFLFSNRFAFLLFPFAGVFYYFLIEYKWKIFKKRFLITTILTIKILYFSYFLHNINIGNNPFNYLDGKVFNSSILDYIEIAYDGFTQDVDIKSLPGRNLIFD